MVSTLRLQIDKFSFFLFSSSSSPFGGGRFIFVNVGSNIFPNVCKTCSVSSSKTTTFGGTFCLISPVARFWYNIGAFSVDCNLYHASNDGVAMVNAFFCNVSTLLIFVFSFVVLVGGDDIGGCGDVAIVLDGDGGNTFGRLLLLLSSSSLLLLLMINYSS